MSLINSPDVETLSSEGTALNGSNVDSDPVNTQKHRYAALLISLTGTVTAGNHSTWVSADNGTTWHELKTIDGSTAKVASTYLASGTYVSTQPICAGLTKWNHKSIVGAFTLAKAKLSLKQEE